MNRCLRLAAIALTYVLSPGCAKHSPPSGIVISDVTVISPERKDPLEHAYVRIVSDQITEVSTRPLSGNSQIDGKSRFLIPGLIDSHVHLSVPPFWPAAMRPDQATAHPDAAAAVAQDPKSYLFFGFTTLVELNGVAQAVKQWNAQETRPDAYFCGGAPIANGYPMANFPEPMRFDLAPYFLYDARQRDRIPASIDPVKHTPEAVVAKMAEDGAACVKTFYETGFGPARNLPTPTLEMVKAVVAAAHARNMPVFIHANSKESQAFAVAAGVDVIAHGMFNGHTGDRKTLQPDAHTILKDIVRDGIGYQPTFQAAFGMLDLFDARFLTRPEVADAYSRALIDFYAEKDGHWFAEQLGSGLDLAALRANIGLVSQTVGELAASKARLLFGTDTPSGPTYAEPPGYNGRLEMDRWIAAGVSPSVLLRAMTLDNAHAMHLDGKIGTIEQGKTANMLLLRSDPLKDAKAYDTIETVFLQGRPIARESLSARHAMPKVP